MTGILVCVDSARWTDKSTARHVVTVLRLNANSVLPVSLPAVMEISYKKGRSAGGAPEPVIFRN